MLKALMKLVPPFTPLVITSSSRLPMLPNIRFHSQLLCPCIT